MKTLKALGILMILSLALGQAALAMDKDEMLHGPAAFVPSAGLGQKAVGDDCSAPIVIPGIPYSDLGQTNCGRGNTYSTTCLGSYDGGEDIVYQLTVASTTYINVTVDPLGTTWAGFTIDNSCPPDASCLVTKTNSSSSAAFGVVDVALAPGTYYIMVDTYPSPNCIPAFNLTVSPGSPPPPPPANDLCEDAEIIPFGPYSITGNTTYATANYSPAAGGCTGYAANGKDVAYAICLQDGDTFDVTMTTSPSYDASIYLVLNCADVANTCVAGGDDPETFSYTNTTGGSQQLYLIVDAYSTGAGGFTISGTNGGNCTPVATSDTNWGTLKTMFR